MYRVKVVSQVSPVHLVFKDLSDQVVIQAVTVSQVQMAETVDQDPQVHQDPRELLLR